MPGAISKQSLRVQKNPVQRAERRGTGRRRSNPCFQQQHLRKTPFYPLFALVMCRFVWKQKMWLIHPPGALTTRCVLSLDVPRRQYSTTPLPFKILSKHLTCVQTFQGGFLNANHRSPQETALLFICMGSEQKKRCFVYHAANQLIIPAVSRWPLTALCSITETQTL